MTIDIEKIRAAADKATPGPWRTNGRHIQGSPCGDIATTRIFTDGDGGSLLNAAHIAACDPTTILALCDEVEKLRVAAAIVGRDGSATATLLAAAESEVERLRDMLNHEAKAHAETQAEVERLNQRVEELGNLLIESAKRVEIAEQEVARLRAERERVVAALGKSHPGLSLEDNVLDLAAKIERLYPIAEAARTVVRAVATVPKEIDPKEFAGEFWWTRDAEKAVEELVMVCKANGIRD